MPAEAGYELERTEGFGMAKRKEKRATGIICKECGAMFSKMCILYASVCVSMARR